MADVRIETTRPDHAVNRQAYDRLTRDFEDLGLSVALSVPQFEKRGGAPPIELSVGIFLAQHVASRLLDEVEAAVRRLVRERKTDRFADEIPIYGPDGEILRVVRRDQA